MYVSCHSHSAHMGWIRTHGLVTHTHTHGLAYTYSQRVRSLSLRSRPSLVVGQCQFRPRSCRFGQVWTGSVGGYRWTGSDRCAHCQHYCTPRSARVQAERCAQRVTGCLARGRASWGEFSVYSSTLDSRHALWCACSAHVVHM